MFDSFSNWFGAVGEDYADSIHHKIWNWKAHVICIVVGTCYEVPHFPLLRCSMADMTFFSFLSLNSFSWKMVLTILACGKTELIIFLCFFFYLKK